MLSHVCSICPAPVLLMLLQSLQVPIPALQAALSGKSMQLLRLPMIEMAAPENFESGAAFVQLLVEQLQDGRSIAMHCKWVKRSFYLPMAFGGLLVKPHPL